MDEEAGTGTVINFPDIEREVEEVEEVKEFNSKSILMACLFSFVALILFWFYSVQEAPFRYENEKLVVIKFISDTFDLKVLKFNPKTENMNEESFLENFKVTQDPEHLKVSPNGKIISTYWSDPESFKSGIKFFIPGKSIQSENVNINDNDNIIINNFCFLPDSKGILIQSQSGFTKYEFDDNFDNLIQVYEIKVETSVQILSKSNFFVTENNVIYFIGHFKDNNLSRILFRKDGEKDAKVIISLPQNLDYFILNYYQNMVAISFNTNYFIISDLSNLKPKKVSIEDFENISNVVFSKSGKDLYILADNYPAGKSIIRVDIDYKNLKDKGINHLSHHKEIIKGDYSEHCLVVL